MHKEIEISSNWCGDVCEENIYAECELPYVVTSLVNIHLMILMIHLAIQAGRDQVQDINLDTVDLHPKFADDALVPTHT